MSLLENLKSLITPDIISRATEFLGLDEGSISKGLSAGLPAAVLAAGAHSPDSPALTNAVTILNQSPAEEDPVKAAQGQDAGTFLPDFLKNVLGDMAEPISRALSEITGAKGAASGGLLALVGGLVMKFLGDKVRGEALTPAGLVDLVSKEKAALLAALPAGLANSFQGVATPNVSTPALREVVETPAMSVVKAKTRWVAPALLAILGAGLAGIIATWNPGAEGHHGEHGKDESASNHQSEPSGKLARRQMVNEPGLDQPTASGAGYANAVNSIVKPLADQPGKVSVNLPGGTDIIGREKGIEAQMVDFILSNKAVDKTTWFNFDALTFETAKATLKPESASQLQNMVRILKAFPNLKIKIGGYTDNVGDEAANQKLSSDRANNVMIEIAKLGVDPVRLEAEGFGSQFPVASNDTEEGRAQNRRIAARVTEK